MVEAFERQPPGLAPVAAIRGALESYNEADLDVIRQTTALTMTVPEVRARAMDEFGRTIAVISEALAKRAGRPADDLAVRTVAGAIIGVIMSITMPWEGWSSDWNTTATTRTQTDTCSITSTGRKLQGWQAVRRRAEPQPKPGCSTFQG